METKQITTLTTDPEDGRTHLWGVNVGDPVHFWRDGAPPLSTEYEAPACQQGLVLGFGWELDPSGTFSWWTADIAVVDPTDGALRIERGIRYVPGSAQHQWRDDTGLHTTERSFGVGPSWHPARFYTEP